MPDCWYYGSEMKVLKSGEVEPDRLPEGGSKGTIEWCEHKHSPLKRDRARANGETLSCGGERAFCPLSAEEYTDQ